LRWVGSSSRIQVCSHHKAVFCPSSLGVTRLVLPLLSAHWQSLAKLHSRFTDYVHSGFKFLLDR
jgi:hypothetical protein